MLDDVTHNLEDSVVGGTQLSVVFAPGEGKMDTLRQAQGMANRRRVGKYLDKELEKWREIADNCR